MRVWCARDQRPVADGDCASVCHPMCPTHFTLSVSLLVWSDHGQPLPLHTVLGLSSCMSMVVGATTKASAGKEKESKETESNGADSSASATHPSPPATCSITVNSYKFVYVDHLPYTLVAQGNSDESDTFLSGYVSDVRDLIQTYLGVGVVASDDLSAIKGMADLIHHMLQKYTSDLSYLCGGTRWVYLEDEVREQIDRALSGLEENSIAQPANTTGPNAGQPDINGTMIVLGNSILHSRITNLTSRMVTQQSINTLPLACGLHRY